jgi:hypothetical protein
MTEIVVENIHDYLRSVGENVKAGRMKQEDFIIFKVCAQSWRPTEIHARHLVDI